MTGNIFRALTSTSDTFVYFDFDHRIISYWEGSGGRPQSRMDACAIAKLSDVVVLIRPDNAQNRNLERSCEHPYAYNASALGVHVTELVYNGTDRPVFNTFEGVTFATRLPNREDQAYLAIFRALPNEKFMHVRSIPVRVFSDEDALLRYRDEHAPTDQPEGQINISVLNHDETIVSIDMPYRTSALAEAIRIARSEDASVCGGEPLRPPDSDFIEVPDGCE